MGSDCAFFKSLSKNECGYIKQKHRKAFFLSLRPLGSGLFSKKKRFKRELPISNMLPTLSGHLVQTSQNSNDRGILARGNSKDVYLVTREQETTASADSADVGSRGIKSRRSEERHGQPTV